MKLKLSFLLALSLVANNAFSICFTYSYESFVSELYFEGDKWHIELCKSQNEAWYLYQQENGALQISCKAGTSMLKASAFDSLVNCAHYFIFTSDSLDTPLTFDALSDNITITLYRDYNNSTDKQIFSRTYGDKTTDDTKKPLEGQSAIYSGSMCSTKASISTHPTPGTSNIYTSLENQQAGINTPLVCNPSPNGNAVRISIDAAFDQKSTLVAVYNISGDEVFLRFLTGETSFEIDTESFPAGIYVVALKNNQGTVMTTAFSVQ